MTCVLAYVCGPCCSVTSFLEPTPLPDPAAPEQMLLWSITALVLLFPVIMRALRPIPRGCCTRCGYSLAGSSEHVVCPECGGARHA